MASSSRGGMALKRILPARAARAARASCWRCSLSYANPSSSRLYSAAAAETIDTSTSDSIASTPPPQSSYPPNPYVLRSGMILTRPPLLTRKLEPFENSFFFYQKRLEERLNTHFIGKIYFKPDTPRQLDWNIKVKERQGTVAKELGIFNGKSARAWEDELTVGDPLSTRKHLLGSLLKDAEVRVSEDAEVIAPEDILPVEQPMSRASEADRKGDVRRLDRKLDRTLYLVVKNSKGWVFPSDELKDENLHQAAYRSLADTAGVNMNMWVVGRVPVAHIVRQPTHGSDGAVQRKGEKTFFIKARIMAGQADLSSNTLGYTDFKWLTREELQKALLPWYYKGVKNMLADR